MIEIHALRALALAAGDDEAAAVTTLADALILAGPQGNVRVFADEGPPMRALVGRVVVAYRAGHPSVRGMLFSHLARLMRAFDGESAVTGSRPETATTSPAIVDPLTPRELDVLEMLAAGTSNQAIAEDLYVTLFTVKKHVSHVLRKLGAANRTEAVARARDLGLIP